MLIKNNDNRLSGFTLIELVVVIAILGILAGLVTVNLQGARSKTRDTQRKADLKQIQNALELYKSDSRPVAYPVTATWADEIVAGGYMQEVPVDPIHKNRPSWPDYTYSREVDTLEYELVACVENENDPDKDAVNNDAVCDTSEGQYSYTLLQP